VSPERRGCLRRRGAWLTGSGRSGTTWLAELLSLDPRTRVIFEPFNRRVVKVPGVMGRPYLRRGEAAPEWLNFISDLHGGTISGDWVDYLTPDRASAHRVLIKEIRSTLLLAWLRQNFDLRVIYLLRHPCAVAESRARLGWTPELAEFLGQQDLMEDHLRPFEHVIAAARDPLQQHAVMWCVENLVARTEWTASEVLVVPYSRLASRPAETVNDVSKFLGWPSPPEPVHTARPSRTTRSDSPLRSGRNCIVHGLDADDERAVMATVEAFGLADVARASLAAY
jgi:hypothetical protein